MLSNPLKASTFIFATCLAFVSMMCSLLLWISFTNTVLDAVLAAITSITLVGTSYIFIPVMMRLLEFRKFGYFFVIFILELILVASSLGATIGWLESRYQSSYYTEISNSDLNKQNTIKFDDYTNRINQLTALAAIDAENNYRQRAERLLNKADRLSLERQSLTSSTSHHITKSSGTTLANDLGESRYILWTVLAVLVDGCPMACFAILSAPGKRTEKPTINTATTKTPNPIQKSFAENESIDDLYLSLANEIQNGKWGEKPAMRKIILDKKIRHATAKTLFERLINENVLIQVGNRFERVA